MKTGWGRWVGRSLAVGAFALGAAAAPAAAQQTDDDCRCVDRDGNQIEDCACFRMPRFDTMMAPFPGARPRLGISVDASQGSQLDTQGAHVTNVLEDGPAWDAGIRVDDVIDPRETRPRLISALDMLRHKRDENPVRKHGNIPL